MSVSYKKLFKLLIDRDMKKKDLLDAAGISSATMSKMNRGEYVSMEVLTKICAALNTDVGDIMEIVPDEKEGGASK